MFYRLVICLLVLCFTFSGQAQDRRNFDAAKMLDIFNAAYRDLELYYVDSLDAEKNIGNALDYMLQQLDPYTEYYKQENTENFRTMTTGKYAGIGSPIRYHKGEDRCVFTNPYHDKPAYKGGVRAGDVLMKINGIAVPPCGKQKTGEYISNITQQLRGTAGSMLLLTVKRGEKGKNIDLKIQREIIKMPSVSHSTLLDKQTGYIVLSTYIEESAEEVKTAFEALKAKGAKRLILDLRGNGGGLMSEAIKIVNMFVPKGKVVLETKGKNPEKKQVYSTTALPTDTLIPIAVLVDYGTASAAEITSGALQDYDRAVILGSRTYGKGLVQAPRPLGYDTMLKLTVSKYYIPSGRCVQALDYKNRGTDGQPTHLPDSLCKTFRTAAGRPVKDGGGITPDISIKEDSVANLLPYLENSDALFDYVVAYLRTHPNIAAPLEFQLGQADWEAFKQHMVKSDFTYDKKSKAALEVLRQMMRMEGYAETVQAELAALEKKLNHDLAADLELWKTQVVRLLEAKIIAMHYGEESEIAYYSKFSVVLKEALKVLNDESRYRRILKKD